jgi:hypothetical protein
MYTEGGGEEMVEPISLTLGTVAAALVVKAAEKSGEQAAESGWAAAGRLLERLRSRFRERGDSLAEGVLTRVEDPPVGQRQLKALAEAVDREAGQDPQFAEELRRLIAQAESGGVKVQQVTQTAWGSQIVLNQDLTGSAVTVTFNKPPA